MSLKTRTALALAAALLGVGCHRPDAAGPGDQAGPAPVAPVSVPGFLDQGWSPAEREAFWFSSQGSRILSYDIFKGLEQAGSEEPFRSATNIRRFGYIPWPATPRNPDGLPIGFVRDAAGERAWMGLTCAACHTGVLSYQGRDLLIDGAPTLADFQGFMASLVEAMRANQEGAKFGRLAARTPEVAKDELLVRLKAETTALEERQARNHSDLAYGFARLDAFGQIFNEVTSHALGIEGNAHPADAPVSYPFLWDTPQSDLVQWPGIAENTPPVGALTRNLGEVLGVFAHLDIEPGGPPYRYAASGRLPQLAKFENQLKRLWRPGWEEAGLPPLDAALRARGEGIYRDKCGDCHHLIDDPKQLTRKITVKMTRVEEVGTDPRMVSNAFRTGQLTGRIEGRRKRIIVDPPLPARAASVEILTNAVAGTLVSNLHDTIEAIVIDQCGLTGIELDAAPIETGAPRSGFKELLQRARDHNRSVVERARDCRRAILAAADMKRERLAERLQTEATGAMQDGTANRPPSYKARPLDGIWATAPYLHNGSVPTLLDLLQPPERRPPTFNVGSREFDPLKVGYRSEGGFVLDTTQDGNRNAGHAYGTDLSDQEKAALLEYLKSL